MNTPPRKVILVQAAQLRELAAALFWAVDVTEADAATAQVDGDGGSGHLATHRATELAIELGRRSGVGAACSRNHGHFGSAGKYTRMVIRQGMAALCVSGHPMRRLTHDAREWNPFGCPPMGLAFPGGEGPPVTSWFSSAERDEWFARNPAPFFKSLGLMAAAHLLGGALPGMMRTPFLPQSRGYERDSYGAFVLAVDVERFVPLAEFRDEVDESVRQAHAVPALPGQERYELPGGPEWERERAWTAHGIPLGREHEASLREIADELGVPVPWR